MATVTKGRTFVSGETVTPAKLNEIVDNATVTAIQTADISDSQITTAKIADLNVTAAKLANTLDLSSKTVSLASSITNQFVPAGAVMPFARATAPAGWLIANGDAVPNGSGTVQGVTADFSALHAALSTSFGAAGTLPDLRGIFVRGSGSQTISGTTYNKTFAAKERDAFQGHRHDQVPSGGAGSLVPGTSSGGAFVGLTTGDPTTDGTNGTPRTATETRPANIALLYCIKF